MDIGKNWARYNILDVKTKEEIVSSEDFLLCTIGVLVGGVLVVGRFLCFFHSHDSYIMFSGIFGVISVGFIIGAIVAGFSGAIVGGFSGAIVGFIAIDIIGVDITPKYRTAPERIKNIAPKKRIKTLTKMCDIGNFIGFEELWKYIEEAEKNIWLEKIIQDKNYTSIAYILALDPKIFHYKIPTYIKNNDTGTVKLLLELGMDQQIFKDDLTLLNNSSDEMKKAIHIATT